MHLTSRTFIIKVTLTTQKISIKILNQMVVNRVLLVIAFKIEPRNFNFTFYHDIVSINSGNLKIMFLYIRPILFTGKAVGIIYYLTPTVVPRLVSCIHLDIERRLLIQTKQFIKIQT